MNQVEATKELLEGSRFWDAILLNSNSAMGPQSKLPHMQVQRYNGATMLFALS
jgi:hypothetical protein